MSVEYPNDERERGRGVTDKQISYMTLIGVHSTVHLVHPIYIYHSYVDRYSGLSPADPGGTTTKCTCAKSGTPV